MCDENNNNKSMAAELRRPGIRLSLLELYNVLPDFTTSAIFAGGGDGRGAERRDDERNAPFVHHIIISS